MNSRDDKYSTLECRTVLTEGGKLELQTSDLLGDERAKAMGSAGDLAVIRTDTVLHRAMIPEQGASRKVYVSRSQTNFKRY
jgi:hypothetical protein